MSPRDERVLDRRRLYPEQIYCFCGCTENEHDEEGCLFCHDCVEFSEDVDTTLELLDQNRDGPL